MGPPRDGQILHQHVDARLGRTDVHLAELRFALESLAASAEARPSRRRLQVRLLGGLGAAAVVVVGGVLASQTRRQPAPPPATPAVTPAQPLQHPPRFTRVTFSEDVMGMRGGAALASDDQTLIFTRFHRGLPSIHLGRLGTEEARPLGLERALLQDVSAGGELLVTRYGHPFVWKWPVFPGTLARIALAGGVPRDLAEDVWTASWGPDGQSIAAIRVTSGQYVLEYPLGTPLYTSPSWFDGGKVSPRGDRIAISEHRLPRDDRASSPDRGRHHDARSETRRSRTAAIHERGRHILASAFTVVPAT